MGKGRKSGEKIKDRFNHFTEEELKNELKKCKEQPVYFYNTYVRKEGQKELTEREWENHVKMVEEMRNPLKLRSRYKEPPYLRQYPDFLTSQENKNQEP